MSAFPSALPWRDAHQWPSASVDTIGTALLLAAVTMCCLPYIVFGPIAAPSQVQPWAALLCWAFTLHRLLTATLRIDGFQILVLIFAIWFLLYIYAPGEVGIDYYLRKSASFLICWSILVAAPYVSPVLLWRVLRISLSLWTGFALLGFVSKGAYLAITRPLVPTAIGVAGGRGATSLAPEATDFGFTMAFMVLLAVITRKALINEGYRPAVWPIAIAVFNVALSKSGSGFFAVLVLAGVHYLTQAGRPNGAMVARVLIGVMVAAALLLTIGSAPETGVRGLDLVILSLRSPVALLNTTLSYRIIHNVVGVLGMIDSNLMGYGAGSFVKVGGDIYLAYNLGKVFGLVGYYAAAVPLSLSGSPLAYFPVLFLEYGLAGLLFVILLFRTVARSGLLFTPLALAMMFMTWVQSFPAAYPPFWLLIGLSLNQRFRKARDLKQLESTA
ncbi:hypothetical protein WBP07_20330 (plasmid) [Novosphingobium sp. BL-8A]|uniref:hypothetical protein n=1 Tax=Novosphingobium sp. BL-8A TaxID=3127639 RepID=UPI003757B78B